MTALPELKPIPPNARATSKSLPSRILPNLPERLLVPATLNFDEMHFGISLIFVLLVHCEAVDQASQTDRRAFMGVHVANFPRMALPSFRCHSFRGPSLLALRMDAPKLKEV